MLVYYSTFIFEIVFNNLYSNEGASTMYSGFSIFVFNRLNLYSYPSWYVNSFYAFRESNTISLLFSSNNCIFLFSLSVIGSTVFTVFESIVAITKLSCNLSFSHCTKIQYAMYINSVSKIFFISNLIRDVDNWAFLSSRLLFF